MGDAITLKTEYQGDKRRISFALSEIALETMRNNIAHKYGLNPETVLLREKDGEAICSDSDLKQALQATKDRNEKCLKLTIVSNPSSTSFLHETSNNTAADDPTTSGTTSTDDVTDSSSSDDSDGVMQHFSTGSSQLQELEVEFANAAQEHLVARQALLDAKHRMVCSRKRLKKARTTLRKAQRDTLRQQTAKEYEQPSSCSEEDVQKEFEKCHSSLRTPFPEAGYQAILSSVFSVGNVLIFSGESGITLHATATGAIRAVHNQPQDNASKFIVYLSENGHVKLRNMATGGFLRIWRTGNVDCRGRGGFFTLLDVEPVGHDLFRLSRRGKRGERYMLVNQQTDDVSSILDDPNAATIFKVIVCGRHQIDPAIVADLQQRGTRRIGYCGWHQHADTVTPQFYGCNQYGGGATPRVSGPSFSMFGPGAPDQSNFHPHHEFCKLPDCNTPAAAFGSYQQGPPPFPPPYDFESMASKMQSWHPFTASASAPSIPPPPPPSPFFPAPSASDGQLGMSFPGYANNEHLAGPLHTSSNVAEQRYAMRAHRRACQAMFRAHRRVCRDAAFTARHHLLRRYAPTARPPYEHTTQPLYPSIGTPPPVVSLRSVSTNQFVKQGSNGEVLLDANNPAFFTVHFIKGQKKVRLQHVQTGRFLRISSDGAIDIMGKGGTRCTFKIKILPTPDSSNCWRVTLKSAGSNLSLEAGEDGKLRSTSSKPSKHAISTHFDALFS